MLDSIKQKGYEMILCSSYGENV